MDVIGQYELSLQEVVGRHFCSHMDQFIERHIGFFQGSFLSLYYIMLPTYVRIAKKFCYMIPALVHARDIC